MLQKNAFGKKNSNFMHGFKSAILEKLKTYTGSVSSPRLQGCPPNFLQAEAKRKQKIPELSK